MYELSITSSWLWMNGCVMKRVVVAEEVACMHRSVKPVIEKLSRAHMKEQKCHQPLVIAKGQLTKSRKENVGYGGQQVLKYHLIVPASDMITSLFREYSV